MKTGSITKDNTSSWFCWEDNSSPPCRPGTITMTLPARDPPTRITERSDNPRQPPVMNSPGGRTHDIVSGIECFGARDGLEPCQQYQQSQTHRPCYEYCCYPTKSSWNNNAADSTSYHHPTDVYHNRKSQHYHEEYNYRPGAPPYQGRLGKSMHFGEYSYPLNGNTCRSAIEDLHPPTADYHQEKQIRTNNYDDHPFVQSMDTISASYAISNTQTNTSSQAYFHDCYSPSTTTPYGYQWSAPPPIYSQEQTAFLRHALNTADDMPSSCQEVAIVSSSGASTFSGFSNYPPAGNDNMKYARAPSVFDDDLGEPERKKKKKKKRNKVADHEPRRPLSAYNFFFSEEKDIVIALLPEHPPKIKSATISTKVQEAISEVPLAHPLKNSNDSATTTDLATENEKRADSMKMVCDTDVDKIQEYLLDTERKLSVETLTALRHKIVKQTERILLAHLEGDREKKTHKKVHGKISFQKLAGIIGKRWRLLSADGKRRYFRLAKEDQGRFLRQKEELEKQGKTIGMLTTN